MAVEQWVAIGLLPLAGFAIGGIPSGLWVVRWRTGTDIRRQGSGNIGATNVRRVAGLLPGLLTLAADAAKGAVPVGCARMLLPGQDAYTALVALAVFTGHLYPLYSRFKGGGKGVATAAGALLVMSPAGWVVTLLVFVLSICVSGRVSVASLSAAAVLPLALWRATGSATYGLAGVAMAVFIWWRHRTNIRRLLDGTEPRFR